MPRFTVDNCEDYYVKSHEEAAYLAVSDEDKETPCCVNVWKAGDTLAKKIYVSGEERALSDERLKQLISTEYKRLFLYFVKNVDVVSDIIFDSGLSFYIKDKQVADEIAKSILSKIEAVLNEY